MAVVRNPSHVRTFPLVYDLPAPRPAGRLLLSTNSIAADRAGWKLIIKRRKFITLLGGAAAARRARRGGGIPRIGVLMSKRSGEELISQRSYRACNPCAGSIAATCGSNSGGPRARPTTFANTPRASSLQRSSWHRAVRSSDRATGDRTV